MTDELSRILEPEVMDDVAEVDAYLAMDHESVNQAFVEDLLAGGPVGKRVLDLGCGTAEIPIFLCQRLPEVEVLGVDSSIAMLEAARIELELGGVAGRVFLEQGDCKSMEEFESGLADTVISNTLLHHLPEPKLALEQAIRLGSPDGRLFIRDLFRPESSEEVERLVQLHAAEESDFAQQLLRQSLIAALTLDEIKEMAGGFGIPVGCVSQTSDRHWTLDWVRDFA